MASSVKMYQTWLRRQKSRGAPLTEYPCPTCGAELNARVPEADHQFDSLCSCPYCLSLHFKVVSSSGTVDATRFE